MTRWRRPLRAIAAAAVAWVVSLSVAQPNQQSEANAPFRVGIVAYDDIRTRAQVMSESFARIGHDLRFAAGTAEEVLDWVSQSLVDIAVLSPGAFAASGAVLTDQERDERTEKNALPAWNCRYLITPALAPSRSPFASRARRRGGGFLYQALCLVHRRSWNALQSEFPGSDVETIKKAARGHRLQFVFGDPLSLSGTIVPRAQLAVLGIDPGSRWEFSFGHRDTLRLLLQEPDLTIGGERRSRLGFVFDGSVAEDVVRMRQDLVTVDLRLTDDLPAEVWVVRPDFGEHDTSELRAALLRNDLGGSGLQKFRDQGISQDGSTEIDTLAHRVRSWAKDAGVELGDDGRTRPIGIAEIVHSMRHYERRYNDRPRLALVLSGGGAKCAYQAGAMASIERQLAELRDFKVLAPNVTSAAMQERVSPDISLVVGTSGGALNALPAAVGVTARPEGAARLEAVWKTIQLTDLLRPYPAVCAALGTLVGVCLTFLTWLLVEGLVLAGARCGYHEIQRHALLASRLIVAAALLGFWAVRIARPEGIKTLAPHHWTAYYGLWIPLNLSVPSAIFVVCVGALFSQLNGRRTPRAESVAFELQCWRRVGIVALLCAVCGYETLWRHRSLSDGSEMQRMIVHRVLDVLGKDVPKNRSKLGNIDQQASALSSAICSRRQSRRRDLVMAVSLLGGQGMADRYVYLPATAGGPPPSYEQRAIDLQRKNELSPISVMEDPLQIIPLMIASGTIFPVFPARTFIDPTGRNEDLYVVDGGFAHNIPVEAAVDWGATHVIVIEASPRRDCMEQAAFLRNVGVAFDHLFAQAQLTDVRSRQKLEIYVLRPDTEILKTLDFRTSLIDAALSRGRQDADAGKFRQYSGPPRLKSLNEL